MSLGATLANAVSGLGAAPSVTMQGYLGALIANMCLTRKRKLFGILFNNS